MNAQTMALIALVVALFNAAGNMANAIGTIVHCFRDKARFKKLGIEE